MDNKELKILEGDIRRVEDKVDNHIEIYQKNGIEIAKNNQLISDYITLDKEHWEQIKPAIEAYHEQKKDWEYIRPMVRDYKTFINGGKIIKAVVYFTLIVGSAITVWYKLFK